MIYSLSGKIIKKTLNAVVVSCGGVGYYVQCPTSVAGALPGVGREATLYTVMSVTENDISLYGFATEEQLELKDKVAKGFVDGINLEDVGAATAAPAAQGAGQAIAALVSLGYSQSEAALAVSKIDASLPVEEIIKLALRGMAGRR